MIWQKKKYDGYEVRLKEHYFTGKFSVQTRLEGYWLWQTVYKNDNLLRTYNFYWDYYGD